MLYQTNGIFKTLHSVRFQSYNVKKKQIKYQFVKSLAIYFKRKESSVTNVFHSHNYIK